MKAIVDVLIRRLRSIIILVIGRIVNRSSAAHTGVVVEAIDGVVADRKSRS